MTLCRILLFFLSFVLCTGPVYAEESGDMAEQFDEDRWTIARGELDGRLTWLRIQRDVEHSVRDSNPHRLVIRWEYQDDGDDGMPSFALKERFRALEEALIHSIHTDDTGVLALVLTSAGSREWHVHFADAEAAQESVNSAFAELPDMPISLTGKFDPDWSEYNYFSSTLADD